MSREENWPSLALEEWEDTYHTLHLWTQIAGKVRMALSPPLNHWWHVALYVNTRGLNTGPIPYPRGVFEIQFDFAAHQLRITSSEGALVVRPLPAGAGGRFLYRPDGIARLDRDYGRH